jgi:hypothetical protein
MEKATSDMEYKDSDNRQSTIDMASNSDGGFFMSHVACRMSHSRSGQSLVEAIIAITLLTVGFLGIAALLAQSLHLTRVVSDQTTATYLAAEGVELAKNLIDHDVYLHLAGLGTGWGSCFGGAGAHDIELDYASTDCSRSFFPSDALMFDPATGIYSYGPSAGSVKTNFTRDIRFALNGNEIVVNSIVRWGTGSFTSQSINLEDHFYNWRP